MEIYQILLLAIEEEGGSGDILNIREDTRCLCVSGGGEGQGIMFKTYANQMCISEFLFANLCLRD